MMTELQQAIEHLQNSDPVLAAIIGRVGSYECKVLEPSFETLARSIAFQQLSTKAASTIFQRLQKLLGKPFTARKLLNRTPEQLRSCGLSQAKIASLRDLAAHVVRKEIDFRALLACPDEEIIERLSKVRGIGVWTAQMFLIFALERPNVMPVADLGIRNAVRKAYGLPEMPNAAELQEIAKHWHPYCSIASWYLWRSLDQTGQPTP